MDSKGFLCISCEYKGAEFIEQAAAMGHRVYLVTSEQTRDDPWPFDLLSDVYYMPEKDGRLWNLDVLKQGVAHIMKSVKIDRMIALDDYDVMKVAFLREEFRMPGMGQTTARHFYDKLAMRIEAEHAGLPVPGFSSLFHDNDINHFLNNSRGPWFVKPRSDAGTLGITKVHDLEEFWRHAETLGDDRHKYLIEEYTPGSVFHVDSLSHNNKKLFTRASEYLTPPFNVAHGGGIFQSCTLDKDDAVAKKLVKLNNDVLNAFGMKHGASHSEYIISEGKIYFLETSARVGGANLSVLVEKATGINLWREWARIESAVLSDTKYELPDVRQDNGGIIASLSRHERPDYSLYNDPEIVWRLDKSHHIGFVFAHEQRERILEILNKYSNIIATDFHASVPPQR